MVHLHALARRLGRTLLFFLLGWGLGC
jgi:hypothetical protein